MNTQTRLQAVCRQTDTADIVYIIPSQDDAAGLKPLMQQLAARANAPLNESALSLPKGQGQAFINSLRLMWSTVALKAAV